MHRRKKTCWQKRKYKNKYISSSYKSYSILEDKKRNNIGYKSKKSCSKQKTWKQISNKKRKLKRDDGKAQKHTLCIVTYGKEN